MKIINNKGYSLIELIIVLAIIAIVSTMSLLSINVLFSAKVKADSQTFNSEIGLIKADRYSEPVDLSGNKIPGAYYALRIYRHSDNRVYVQKCAYNPVADVFITSNIDKRNDGRGLKLTSYTSVSYAEQKTGTVVDITGTGEAYVVYDKDGTIHLHTSGSKYYGAGKFMFKKRNGDIVANVYVRGNGSHNVR